MSKDKGILVVFWVTTIVLLTMYIPKNKLRNGIVAFLYKQVVTWLFGILVVEKGLIKYPVRLFEKANKTSFTFEYFIFPSFCALFNLHYPQNKNKLIKFLYYVFHSGIITGIEVLVEKNTNLIKYVKWRWYYSFVTIGISYYTSRLFYRWFFKSEFQAETQL